MFAPAARAGFSYLSQDRSITATTTADGATKTLSAPDFAPFVDNLQLSTPFDAAGGGTGTNTADAGIDCQLDPNAIITKGSLGGTGGLAVVAGDPTTVLGEAGAVVRATFVLDFDSPFTLIASARPDLDPKDRYRVKLEDLTRGGDVFFLDESSPPQAVNMTGTLLKGEYSLEFEVEITVAGSETLRDFNFLLQVPSPGAGIALLLGLPVFRRRR